MNLFFGQRTLAANYFHPRYLQGTGATPTNDTKSGYWRLFYYKMQEEALKVGEEVVEKIETKAKRDTVVLLAAKKKAPKPRVELEKDFVPEPLPKFKPLPVYTEPSVHELLDSVPSVHNFAVFINRAEIKLFSLAVAREQKIKRRHVRRRVAAFLLLAA